MPPNFDSLLDYYYIDHRAKINKLFTPFHMPKFVFLLHLALDRLWMIQKRLRPHMGPIDYAFNMPLNRLMR